MHADADKVREGLSRIRHNLGCFGRTGAEHGRNVDLGVFENGVGRSDGTEVAARAREWNPWSWGDLALLVDHFGCGIGGAAAGVKQRGGPIGKGNAGSGRAVRLEVAKAIRHRLPHTVRVNTRE